MQIIQNIVSPSLLCRGSLCGNICLDYGCSACCNPVKLMSFLVIDIKNAHLPFIEMDGILIPEQHPDSVRLKGFICENFNCKSGLCMNYENRPAICRNSTCKAFETEDEAERIRLIKLINSESYIHIDQIKRGGH